MKQTTETIAPGTIYRSIWGHEQTNIDYYEVTRATASTVWLRPIAKETDLDPDRPCGDMSRYVKPCPGQFTGPEKRHRIRNDGSVKLRSFEYARRIDRPSYRETYYA